MKAYMILLTENYLPTTAVHVWSPLSMIVLMTYRNTFEFDSVKHVI